MMEISVFRVYKSQKKFNEMKRNLVFLFIITALSFSCSKDDDKSDNEQSDESAIIGSWQATEFKATNSNSSSVNLGAEILANLTAEDCYIIKFTFNENLSLVAENAVDYLEINATATGLVVPCPTQSDTETSTYTFDGTTLTTIDSGGAIVEVRVSIDGDIMSANATDLDIPNFDGEGELIFEKI